MRPGAHGLYRQRLALAALLTLLRECLRSTKVPAVMTNADSAMLTLDTRVVRDESQITSELGDESVILSLSDGMYYGLDAIGTRIWGLLDRPRPIREICNLIEQDYDVSAVDCETAVLALVNDLVSRRLVDVEP